MDDDDLLEVLDATVVAVRLALDGLDDWGPTGGRPGEYRCDVVADAAALAVLHGAGLPVLSEESGLSGMRGPLLVVLDPVDGSTNASLGLPWFATSLSVLDEDGPRAALVVNQASGVRYEAIRGRGALRDGTPIEPSGCEALGEAVIGVSGFPGSQPKWGQVRMLGSAALDHCAVADGSLDGYTVAGGSWLNAWDYLGGLLVCLEAGAVVAERHGADLVVRGDERRAPVAAATTELLSSLLDPVFD